MPARSDPPVPAHADPPTSATPAKPIRPRDRGALPLHGATLCTANAFGGTRRLAMLRVKRDCRQLDAPVSPGPDIRPSC
jgi:hypothetical protein